MKIKTLLISLPLISVVFVLNPANAGELLIGAKVGVIDPEFDSIDNSDPFAATTIGLGYEFLDLIAVDIAAELEFTSSLADGSLASNDYNYQSRGLIFSLRTAGPIYFVGRAGFQSQEFDFTDSTPDPNVFSSKDNATVIGAGIGFSTGLRWEIQLDKHSYQNKDNTLWNDGSAYYLNIGLSF